MISKAQITTGSSPDRSTRDPTGREASTVRGRPNRISPPSILDAVCDQHGDRWVRYGKRERAIWFAHADLITEASTVFRRLSSVGAACLTSASQSALRREVEAKNDFRSALVAARPGWLDGFYVFGDGTFIRPRSDNREVIITFEAHPKFTPCGSLAEWQKAVEPFVADQPIPFFVLALALTGPILRFAPRGYINPQVEIVGKGETGKTSVAVLAASIWAGDPESDCGGGELWDMTLNALDPIKFAHRDGFVFLDEGNLAGVSLKDRRDFVRQAVFKIAATGGKRRLGDAVQSEQARLALLSTTNTALVDLLDGSTDVRDAAQSRMITIRIAPDAPHGVFAFVPPGYNTAREASEAMRGVADQFWGVTGRAFIKQLVDAVERDEDWLRRMIARSLDSYIRLDRAPLGSARIQKTFAIAAVAAALAQRWGILPKAWGTPMRIVQAVAPANSHATPSIEIDALAAIRSYVTQHRALLIEMSSLPRPMERAQFEAAIGFLRGRGDDQEILIPAGKFQASFSDYKMMMQRQP